MRLFLLSWLRDSKPKSKPSSPCRIYQLKKHLHQEGSKLRKKIYCICLFPEQHGRLKTVFFSIFQALDLQSLILSFWDFPWLSQDMPKIHQQPRRKASACSATEPGLWSKFLQDLRELHLFYFPTSYTVPIFIFSHLKKEPSNKAQYHWKNCSNALKFENPHDFCWRGRERNVKPYSLPDITQTKMLTACHRNPYGKEHFECWKDTSGIKHLRMHCVNFVTSPHI